MFRLSSGGDLFAEAILAEPAAEVLWFRGSKLLKSDNRQKVSYDRASGRTTLSVVKLKNVDEAQYTIKIFNDAGEELDFAGFSIFVKGEPKTACVVWLPPVVKGVGHVEAIYGGGRS